MIRKYLQKRDPNGATVEGGYTDLDLAPGSIATARGSDASALVTGSVEIASGRLGACPG